MHPDLLTKLIFNDSAVVEVSSDYVSTVWVVVSDINDDADTKRRDFQMEPDEIDLFIATLNLYKNRIVGGRKND